MRRLALISALLLSGCGGPDEPAEEPITLDPASEGGGGEAAEMDDLVVGDGACETDADCVPAGCCHAAACVAREDAPDCGDVMCTMDCQYGTLDCGGACLCHESRCAARLSRAPVVSVEGASGP